MQRTKSTSSHKTRDTKGSPKRNQRGTSPPPKVPFCGYILCCLGVLSEGDPAYYADHICLCPCEQPKRTETPCSQNHWWHRSNFVHRYWSRWISFKHRRWERQPEFELCNEPVVERARPGGRHQRASDDDESLCMSGALQDLPCSGDVPARGNGGKTARPASSIPGIGSVFHKTRSRNTI